MVYQEYEEYKKYYQSTQREHNEILNEQERLFARTQPQSTSYDKDKTRGGKPSNSFEEYVIAKEEKDIERRLNESRKLLTERRMLLKLKEEELRASKDWFDILYVYRYLDRISNKKMEQLVPYSKAQMYRNLKVIKKNIK